MGLFARVSFRLNCSDNSTAFAFGGGNNGGRGHREVGRVGRGIKQNNLISLEIDLCNSNSPLFTKKTLINQEMKLDQVVSDSIELKSHQEMKLDLLENKTPKVSSKTRNSLPVFTGSGAKLTLLNA
ncbi:hypothetical protein RIR_jg19688.t1 [Rhizophagus irregularis DAOM 181602=DAOM 197198]|nr:hypothetical protein RIR_jg19688.t1 [Rhizophagus irregularis DAOM 181602=DAOM 197198]